MGGAHMVDVESGILGMVDIESGMLSMVRVDRNFIMVGVDGEITAWLVLNEDCRYDGRRQWNGSMTGTESEKTNRLVLMAAWNNSMVVLTTE